MKDEYHHGDLRRALLEAAEAELEATGVEGFSLRRVAKRAGVSHAAPAHHFGDARGVLTALAVVGFERFITLMQAREAAVPDDPEARLVAQGLGYVDFATRHTALFHLVFSSQRPDCDDAALVDAGARAFSHMADQVARIVGVHPLQDETAMNAAAQAWAAAHGLADLIGAGRMSEISELPATARDARIAAILRPMLPVPTDPAA